MLGILNIFCCLFLETQEDNQIDKYFMQTFAKKKTWKNMFHETLVNPIKVYSLKF